MTRDEILNMPAGRATDALVAEKVMGWKKIQDSSKEYPNIHANVIGEDSEGVMDRVHDFSTDISGALEVADRINKMIFEDKLTLYDDYNYLTLVCTGYTTGYAASFDCLLEDEWWEDVSKYKYAARGETASLAINRAALLAVMDKK